MQHVYINNKNIEITTHCNSLRVTEQRCYVAL